MIVAFVTQNYVIVAFVTHNYVIVAFVTHNYVIVAFVTHNYVIVAFVTHNYVIVDFVTHNCVIVALVIIVFLLPLSSSIAPPYPHQYLLLLSLLRVILKQNWCNITLQYKGPTLKPSQYCQFGGVKIVCIVAHIILVRKTQYTTKIKCLLNMG